MEPTEKRKFDGEDGDASNAPKKRVMGPAMPPTSAQPEHETAPASDGSDSDSESDDDFGPSLPPPDGISVAPVATAQPAAPAPEKENKRDEWMMAPPDGSDWASKIDPTQIRSRKFNTGRSARSGGSKELDSSWVETPEERMRRLGDAVMGVGAPSSDKQPKASTTARDKSMEERIKKFNVSVHYAFWPMGLNLHCYSNRVGRTPASKVPKHARRRTTTQVRVHLTAKKTWQSHPRSPMRSVGKWSIKQATTALASPRATTSKLRLAISNFQSIRLAFHDT
jgi:hypothetical protein